MRRSHLAIIALVVLLLALIPAVLIYLGRLREEEEDLVKTQVRSAEGKLAAVSSREYVLTKPLTWLESLAVAGTDVIYYTVPELLVADDEWTFNSLIYASYDAVHAYGLSCPDIRRYVEREVLSLVSRYERLNRLLFEDDCRWLRKFVSSEESWYASMAIAPAAVRRYLGTVPKDAELVVFALTVAEVGEKGVERVRVKLYNAVSKAEREELKAELMRLAGGRILFIYNQLLDFWHDLFAEVVSEGVSVVHLRIAVVRLSQTYTGPRRPEIVQEVLSPIMDAIPLNPLDMLSTLNVAIYYDGGRIVRMYTHDCPYLHELMPGISVECVTYFW